MAADEVRARLRRRLVEEYGVEEADMLLDRPPGGWGEVVTRDWLQLVLDPRLAPIHERLASIDRRFDAVDARFASIDSRLASIDSRFASIDSRLNSIDSRLMSIESEIRAQTWKLVAAMTGLLGALVAAIKL